MNQHHRYKLDFDNDFQLIYNSFSDYLSTRMSSSGSYESRHDRLYTGLTTILENLHTFQFGCIEITELQNKADREIAVLENVALISIG